MERRRREGRVADGVLGAHMFWVGGRWQSPSTKMGEGKRERKRRCARLPRPWHSTEAVTAAWISICLCRRRDRASRSLSRLFISRIEHQRIVSKTKTHGKKNIKKFSLSSESGKEYTQTYSQQPSLQYMIFVYAAWPPKPVQSSQRTSKRFISYSTANIAMRLRMQIR